MLHDDPRFGEFAVAGIRSRLSQTLGDIPLPGPDLGADNEEVYGEWLGLTEEEVGALRKKGVI